VNERRSLEQAIGGNLDSMNKGQAETGASTDLYLVRIWRRRSGEGALSLHGKLQHAVSGASCYFDGLSGLPEAMEQMMEQGADSYGSFDSEVRGPMDDAE
jgi:hypothetical protein